MNECLGEITVFEKSGGPLTKRIALVDGKIVNDSSACFMAHGSARRVKIDSVAAFADLINNFASNQAYALGRLKDGVPDGAKVVPRDKLNGAGDPSVIARTKDYLVFGEGEPGFVLLDVDVKGMPETVKRRVEECGGLWGALCEALPALETVTYVERASTSSGLRNTETDESFPGSGGCHIVMPVVDAGDIPRFLSDLHDRLWLAGLGWGMVSAAGSFLERSLVDKSCGSPERLIFEASPILVPPLVQTSRNAVVHDGFVLDTRSCAPLTDAENTELRKLKPAENHRLLPEREAKRAAWSVRHIARLTATGMPEAEARTQVNRWIDRQELSGTFPLLFDDTKLDGKTVADVLAAPDEYIEKTLSDPFEGLDYGRGKAILYRRANGSLFIKSFAHGDAYYELETTTKANDDAELERLARLPRLDYERQREAGAERLGIRRLSALDAEVKAKRSELGLAVEDDSRQGRPITYPEPEPWGAPVDGAALLDEIVAAVTRFMIMPPHGANITALWNAHTYLLDIFTVTPRLQINAPDSECGKTTLLYIIHALAYRSQNAAAITPALTFRLMDRFRPTLTLDEADALLPDNEELRQILDIGHHRFGEVPRLVQVGDQYEPRTFRAYGAIAFALIGRLHGKLRTLDSRSIPLKRKLKNETVDTFDVDSHPAEMASIRRRIVRWTKDNAAAIAAAKPNVPLSNRRRDNWLPLFKIAAVAGGEWPARVLAAATNPEEAAQSQLEQLLADVRDVFGGQQIQSADLVKALVALEGRPWAEMGKSRKPLTQNRLARMLKPLGIAPDYIGPEDDRSRGYRLADFREAFDRYLDPLPKDKPSPNPQSPPTQLCIRAECDEMGTSDISQLFSPDPGCTVAKCEKPNNDGVLHTCTVAKGGTGGREGILPSRIPGPAPAAGVTKPPPYKVLGPVPPLGGGNCTICGKGPAMGNGVSRISHGGKVHIWHTACANRHLAAEAEGGTEPGLSPHTIRDLASWYVEEGGRQRVGPGLDQEALDGSLRQRLVELGVSPEFIAVEFERVMQAVFAVPSTGPPRCRSC